MCGIPPAVSPEELAVTSRLSIPQISCSPSLNLEALLGMTTPAHPIPGRTTRAANPMRLDSRFGRDAPDLATAHSRNSQLPSLDKQLSLIGWHDQVSTAAGGAVVARGWLGATPPPTPSHSSGQLH